MLSVTNVWLSMDHWWNDCDMGKKNVLFEESESRQWQKQHCHFPEYIFANLSLKCVQNIFPLNFPPYGPKNTTEFNADIHYRRWSLFIHSMQHGLQHRFFVGLCPCPNGQLRYLKFIVADNSNFSIDNVLLVNKRFHHTTEVLPPWYLE